jgi:sulfide:quinone oxidoreductase
LSVLEPFDGPVAPTYPLQALARAAGARLVRGRAARVDAADHALVTEDGRRLGYEVLVAAVGCRRLPFLEGALTFAGPCDVAPTRDLLGRIRRAAVNGVLTRLAFVVPPGPGWPLPAYELALLTADHLCQHGVREAAHLTLVTAEETPLAAFGERASAEVAADLSRAGIEVHCGAVLRAWAMGRLHLIPGRDLPVDRVVALPAMRGPAIAGLPRDALGFIRADRQGRVPGCDDIYVVGDAGPFPIKSGGLGCQQADAVASRIAGDLGAAVSTSPFEPTLTALVLEGGEQRHLRAEPTMSGEASLGESWLYELRRPSGKVPGHFLTPVLEGLSPPLPRVP